MAYIGAQCLRKPFGWEIENVEEWIIGRRKHDDLVKLKSHNSANGLMEPCRSNNDDLIKTDGIIQL